MGRRGQKGSRVRVHNSLCDELGISHPIFAFSPFPAVVAAVSKAGGMGVLGAIGSSTESLGAALSWLDEELRGYPYGVDIVMPQQADEFATRDPAELMALIRPMIPAAHWQFVDGLMERFQIPALPEGEEAQAILGLAHEVARSQAEVAFAHPIRLIANALGTPPADIMAEAKRMGIHVAALAGKRAHAERHVRSGVDIVVCQSYEAGGHTGEIGGMVLLPEVVDAVAPTPVLAAGAMATGRQMAAALALGAAGIWSGSVWLTTREATGGRVPERLLKATSSDTVRTKAFTGKSVRALRTAWTDAWEEPGSPGTLPTPLQSVLIAESSSRIALAGRDELAMYPVGQVVGMLNEVKPATQVIEEMLDEYRSVVAGLPREL